jgi:hypothetical protein
LPAANAALVALMQNTKTTAATISIINLMAKSFPKIKPHRFPTITISPSTPSREGNNRLRCRKAMHALHNQDVPTVPNKA